MLQPLLEGGSLFALFQPIVDLRRGTIFGHEALIRGPVGTPLHAPLALLELAAREARLTEFELYCVDVILAEWRVLGAPGRLFLNLGSDALNAAMSGERPCRFERALAKHDIDVCSVTVEITEQRHASDITALRLAVKTLQSLGGAVALTVDQLDGGEFHWLLLESFDHSMEFEQLTASAVCYGTYVEALEAGFGVLKAMSPDPRVGPREIDDHPDND